jgi:LCP family protein required for cell wall assembly
MGDGDNATPGDPDSGSKGPSKWLTRTTRPAPAAAPWERRPIPPADEPEDDGVATGNHTDGVPVADLFARLTGEIPAVLQQHPDTEPGSSKPAHGWPDDVDPPTIPVASAYASQIPELGAPPPPQTADDTLVLPAVEPPARRAAPALIGFWRRSTAADPVPAKRHRRAMLAGRAVAAMMAVLALVLTGGAWQWTAAKNNRLNNVAALDLNSRDIVDPNAQFGDENFLIVGADSRLGENADMGAGNTADAEGARSDTVMLVNIPADRKRVVAVSFPRDTAITPMKCEAWDARNGQYGPVWDDETETYGPDEIHTETKLNSAYAFGGPKCLVKVIQKISGLSINRFMAIDFAGFAKMVDALGGVEVCSTTPLEDYELGTVLPTAGRQIIDGHTALNYVRARQVTTEYNGDYGRIKRQQMFLSSLLRSLISKDTFFSLSKLNNVVNMFINDSYVDNIQTKDLVDLGQSIQGVSAGRVTFVTLPTTGITDEDGNEVPNDDAIRALFDAIINDDPLPGENDQNETTTPVTDTSDEPTETTSTTRDATAEATQSTAPTVEEVNAVTAEPHDVTVHVSNSTGETGLGSTASTELQEHGFNVDAPDDYSEIVSTTTVMYSPGNEQAAATVAAALGSPRIERVTGMGQTVNVVLGPDFAGVKTPPPSGSAISVQVTHTGGATPTALPEDLTVTNGADTTCE